MSQQGTSGPISPDEQQYRADREQSEEKVREALALNKMIIETAPEGILIYKASGQCIAANPAAARSVGGTVEQLCAQNFRQNKAWKMGGLLDAADVALESGELVTREFHLTSTFGKEVWYHARFVRFSLQGETHLLLMLQDIKERKLVEAALLKAQQLESLGVFAGGIAHDFNNLLGGIFGFVDLARGISQDAQVSEYLEEAMSSMSRARALTQQLLTFAKGGTPLQKVSPLVPFLQETVKFVLSGSNVACTFQIEPSLWLCNYDRNQIGQVVDNIVINAMQAMPAGGEMQVSAANTVAQAHEHPTLAPGKYVRLSFQDRGGGIPKEVMPHIFDPFFTTKPKGSGLGLSICYSIVKRHGGCIEIESELGKGSVFHVFLPAADGSVVEEQKIPQSKYQRSGKILLMDDQEVIRKSTCGMLAQLGYSCVSTSNGQEALQAFLEARAAGTPFGAILLDLTIPGGMGGKETAHEIRRHDQTVPLFVTSGYADDPVLANPHTYGFTAGIRKPFTGAELSALLARHYPVPSAGGASGCKCCK